MNTFSTKLSNDLMTFQQRKLTKAELFLLAKAIADILPLIPQGCDSIPLHNIGHRGLINDILYKLCEYTHIDQDMFKMVYGMIDELTMWRYKIAYEPPFINFSGETTTVVDDLSCMLRYVDNSSICAVSDVAGKATWYYAKFREAAAEVKLLATPGA